MSTNEASPSSQPHLFPRESEERDAIMIQVSLLLFLCFVPNLVKALSTATGTPRTKELNKPTISSIQEKVEQELRSETKHDNEAWNALFLNVPEKPNPLRLPEGSTSLPRDFPPGCLLRIGPNGAPVDEGWMDGDGFINCITFPPNGKRGTFSSTYVETRGRQLEAKANGRKRFLGTLGSVPKSFPMLRNVIQNMVVFGTLQGQKDTSNTALAEHGGRVLALMDQCPPSVIQVGKDGRVHTVASNCHLDGAIPNEPVTGGSLSAHGRTCPRTGERIHVSSNYNSAPYIRADTFDLDWKIKRSVAVDVHCPTMLHDCAITKNYIVIFDFPLTIRNSRFLKNRFPMEYEPEYGARIGLLPRDATMDTTVWFDCTPGVVLHTVNAFEKDDGKVTVQVLRSEPPSGSSKTFLEDYAPSFLYEYELDTRTKSVMEGCLNPHEVSEFPIINDNFQGKPVDYVYCSHVCSIGGPLQTHSMPATYAGVDGVTKFALQDANGHQKGAVVGKFTLPKRWFLVAEPTVVPKTDGRGEYVLLIATHVPEGTVWRRDGTDELKSAVLLLDGDTLDCAPVWARDLPHHVHLGLHSTFLPWETMV